MVAGVVMTTPETVGAPAAVVAMFPMVIDDTTTGVGPPITDESPDPAKAAGAMATALSAATPPMMARIFFIFFSLLIKPMPELSKPDNYLGGWLDKGNSYDAISHHVPQLRMPWTRDLCRRGGNSHPDDEAAVTK